MPVYRFSRCGNHLGTGPFPAIDSHRHSRPRECHSGSRNSSSTTLFPAQLAQGWKTAEGVMGRDAGLAVSASFRCILESLYLCN